MHCEHPSITAGLIRVGERVAVGAYCPACRAVTWTANGREPLRQHLSQPAEDRDAALRAWLCR